ncbi:uncharacterized protein LAESUDRAFT_745160 [Laetiporus sulphureus 93-53]|uniref:Uncharacterized protein n=1 Tax=Laetiporus sulphureus 93-53 TaxID=1314785 RepID=A0A165C1E4_9APHY|nr:uncharacterized protein LAESUDRAFT_745160 [Laetiporus sulphureus 93-53]KZT02025.1 hypothetical protein LAESUDRAFT_745160 [Laetiporus sulphureus 93-53]
MQELLLNHYVAYRAGRSFVFSNYTWNDDRSLYSYFNNKPIPSQIPYTALIQGPTVGAPMRADPAAPLAVMKDFWDKVCPNPTVIRNDDVIASLGRTTTAQLMIDKWVELLTSTEDPCVEVAPDSWQLFDIFILGDPNRLLDAWPSFSASPILTEIGWSPLIELAFDENRELILPSSTQYPLLSSTPFTHTNAQRYRILPGLLVLHARHGDFEEHCQNLADWDSGYTGYNAFSSLPDRFEKPRGVTPEEKREIYRRHCYPTIEEIAQRAEEVRKSEAGRGLRGVYIMTNGPVAWVSALKAAFDASGKWAHVASSRDLVLNQEQKYVQQAVDMLIGQRAQFSSLSGQVIMLRMANGISPETNRHWQPVRSLNS